MTTSITEKEFQNIVVKRVREDSRKLVMPTGVNALLEIVPGLNPDEFIPSEKYEDIKLIKAFTGAKYLFSTKHITETLAMSLVRSEEMKPVVVEKVRDDSKDHGKPTTINAFPLLIPDLSKEELHTCYTEIKQSESFQDIKSITAFNGAIYYYSQLYLDPAEADRLVRLTELQKKIVDKVRGDTKYLSQLTKLTSLLSLAPDLEPDEVRAAILEAQKNDNYVDIELLTAKNGSEYLFSQTRMTMSYAQVLLRTEMEDPAYTIAETVREESRVYPRPTNIEIFRYGLFKMDRERLDEYVDKAMEEYEDLMLLDLEGSVFLYSSLYMTEEQAILVAAKARREN